MSSLTLLFQLKSLTIVYGLSSLTPIAPDCIDRSLGLPNDTGMAISKSQEDYLRTIHDLARGEGRARVADIARVRGVSMASVCEALHKLDREGLVSYSAGESISLTEEGVRQAVRLSSVHDFLLRFLREVLGVNREDAEKDACSMEHSLSADTISHLVALSQFADSRLHGGESLLEAFRRSEADGSAAAPLHRGRHGGWRRDVQGPTIADIPEGGSARVVHLHASCPIRRRLADMGILPGVEIELVRRAPLGGPIEIALDGFSLTLRRGEASRVEVEPLP